MPAAQPTPRTAQPTATEREQMPEAHIHTLETELEHARRQLDCARKQSTGSNDSANCTHGMSCGKITSCTMHSKHSSTIRGT